jgi:hypothetical protein
VCVAFSSRTSMRALGSLAVAAMIGFLFLPIIGIG